MSNMHSDRKKIRRNIITACILSLGLSTGVYSVFASTESEPETQEVAQPVRSIGYHVVNAEPIDIADEVQGRTVAAYTAEVRPQVSGIVIKQLFEEGGVVKKDQPLYQIDPSEYEASLASAKASLKKAEATMLSARNQYRRFNNLLEKHAISVQRVDDAYATYLGAQADIESAKAAIKRAEINLNYTTIKSPIDGRVGRSTITEGALVIANQGQRLVTVQSFNPIHVDLTASTSDLISFRRATTQGKYKESQSVDDVTLLLEDGSEYPFRGTFKFNDLNVNQSTSSYTLRVEFPNDDEFLLPGMFVRARLPKAKLSEGVLVPAKALVRNAKGNPFVYIINNEDKIESRPVTTGDLRNGHWVILDGLDIEEKVVVQGLQFVQPDMLVSNAFNIDQMQITKAEG